MNWGNKLLLVFVVFGTGMTYLVYRATQTEFELVEKDYYKKEIGYQDQLDAMKNVAKLSDAPALFVNKGNLQINFPDELQNRDIKGSLWLYCPYKSALDRKIEWNKSGEESLNIPVESMIPGNYIAKISWESQGVDYYIEKNITLP